MKRLFPIILCFFAVNGFAQTVEAITEEKSSAWIKVLEDPVLVSKPPVEKKQTSTVKKKTATPKPAKPKQDTKEGFEQTNRQVNRFKKRKKE
jgi:hypothetical protein